MSAVSTRTRFEVFKRDRFTCQYCGQTPPAIILHCDHILALSNGGGSEMDNLVTSCASCNLGKSNVPIDVANSPILIDISERRDRLEQLKAYESFLAEECETFDRWVEELLIQWEKLSGKDVSGDTFFYCPKMERSLYRFLRLLPVSEIKEAMGIAFDKIPYGSQTERYFYGVLWKKVRDKEKFSAELKDAADHKRNGGADSSNGCLPRNQQHTEENPSAASLVSVMTPGPEDATGLTVSLGNRTPVLEDKR